jgi:anti-anti-sigma factor
MEGITTQELGRYIVVEFHTPSLMDPVKLTEIGESLYRLVDLEDRRCLVLDFEEVQYVSSQFVGILMGLHKRLSKLPKSRLICCSVGPRIAELLKITRLDKVLEIRPSQKEAVADR